MDKFIFARLWLRIMGEQARRSVGLAVLATLLGAALLLTPASARAEETVHIVRRGESLGMIAQQHGVALRDLIRYNQLANPNILVAGQRIRIPDEDAVFEDAAEAVAPEDRVEVVAAESETMEEVEEIAADEEEVAASPMEATLAAVSDLPGMDGYHFVRPNESLSGIATSYGLTLADLMRLNDISDPNLLRVGQQLRITVRVPSLSADADREPAEAVAIHIVQAGETLKSIAGDYGTNIRDLMAANGLPNEHFVFPGQQLRIHSKLPRSIINLDAGPSDGKRWIEVDLTDQTLTAWQGDVPVMQTIVSTGKASTPTVKGRFTIGAKYDKQRMIGSDYNIPNVPSVMYFYGGYAIHGAYWEPPFGTPSTHGCVNVRPSEAALLYDWAAPGTEVWVHE